MSPPKPPVEPLTMRELQILTHMCDGLSNEEISRTLHVSLDTVKFHLKNAYGKLGVVRRTQAVATAVYLDLVRPTWAAGQHEAWVSPRIRANAPVAQLDRASAF